MSKNQENMPDVGEIVKATQTMAMDHAKLFIEQYKTMKGIYGWPNKAFMDSIRQNWPEWAQEFFKKFDIWVEDQMKSFEENTGGSIKDYAKNIMDLKFTAPNMNRYRVLVDEHTKLWIENYEKLMERREQTNQEWFENLKKTLPSPIYPILETAYNWVMEQNTRMEKEIIERVKKLSLDLEPDEE